MITTVLDHDVPHDLNKEIKLLDKSDSGPYGYNGTVLSFTGELFSSNEKYKSASYSCYQKIDKKTNQISAWSATLSNVYVGTEIGSENCRSQVALNYDNHPGYDYGFRADTPVFPAADGSIIFKKCIKTFANTKSCEDYGAVAIDHGNGFVTQYLHMSNVYYGDAAHGSNQIVTRSYQIGLVSDTGLKNFCPSGCPHLHFEVLQRKLKPVDNNNYYDRSNYVIVDPYGYKTTSAYANSDKLLSKPGCLWKAGCQY